MSFVREEMRLTSIIEEVLQESSDESSSEHESDHCSEHNLGSETEQEVGDLEQEVSVPNDDIPLSERLLRERRCSSVNVPAPYKSKDGQKLYKNAPRTNVRTRSENIIFVKPGVKGTAKGAKTETECWNIFITEEMKSSTGWGKSREAVGKIQFLNVIQRTKIIEFYFENHRSVILTQRAYRQHFNVRDPPSKSMIQRLEQCFQQHGAVCDLPRSGRPRSVRNNPPRSPDLTAPDFFLWGYLKEKVYANKPRGLDQLKENIRTEIRNIMPATLTNVMENVLKRAQLCEAKNGQHLSDVIFYT
ncbi:hypothetical protein ANTPLA_LOCUS8940 [Anthophora plagiata]